MTDPRDVELDGALLCQWITEETGLGEAAVAEVLHAFARYLCRLGLAEVEPQPDGSLDVTLLLPEG